MRSITPVIAIVILLLMTIAAGGMAYLTITTFQESAQTGAEAGSQQIFTQAGKTLKVESAEGGKIYIRNIGSQNLEKPVVYIDGKPVNITGCETVEPGKVCVITIEELIDCGPDQKCTLQISDYTLTGEIVVEEENLEQGEEGPPDIEAPEIGTYWTSGFWISDTGDVCFSECAGQGGSWTYTSPKAPIYFNVTVNDTGTGNSNIRNCQYYDPTKGGETWTDMDAVDGSYDSSFENVTTTFSPTGDFSWEYVNVTCYDDQNNMKNVSVFRYRVCNHATCSGGKGGGCDIGCYD